LISYQDAIGVHTQDMERAANAGDDDDYESGNQEQYIILTYLKYNYLLLRVRRDYTIMNELDTNSEEAAKDAKLSKQKLLELWKDYLKVNDTILSSLNEVKELPGIANDDDVMDFLTSVDNFFKVKKQMKLSQAYLVENKYMESLALIANASTILDETKPFATTSEGNLPNNDSLKNLKENAESERAKAFTLTQYFNNQKSESRVGSEYLIDNIDRFPEVTGTELLKKIAPAGIDFQPVNAKPVLFDIAYNYIKYPGEMDSIFGAVSADAGAGAPSVSTTKVADYNEEPVREDVVEEGEKKKSGFFGLFGR
jgi:signal recognition particle subunit SRP68